MGQGQPPYVALADATRWVVKNPRGHRLALWSLGFRGLPFIDSMSVRFRRPLDFPAMGRLATRLRDLGFAFSAGRDWSPAEIASFLRDEGYFEGPYSEIYWAGRGVWHLRGH